MKRNEIRLLELGRISARACSSGRTSAFRPSAPENMGRSAGPRHGCDGFAGPQADGDDHHARHYQPRSGTRRAGWTDLGLPSLEGYINARVLAEGLRRAGPSPTRESLLAALESFENFDVGGMRVAYGKGRRLGSRFVDVAMLGQGGRFIS